MSDFVRQVYRVVQRCPRGKVISYGAVAAMLGRPRAARAVGSALRALPEDTRVPWWRVLNSKGEISLPDLRQGAALQRTLLQREGVKFSRAGRIDWRRHGWQPRRAHTSAS